MESFKIEDEVKINRVQTEIPNLADEPLTSKRRELLDVDEGQLWYIFLGLSRLELIPTLEEATKAIAQEIHKLGKETYEWV